MKILLIGQLPKEVGGSYTTGVCNVVYELSRQKYDNVEQTIFAINISDENASKINGVNTYRGRVNRLLPIITKIIKNPISSFKEWYFYRRVCHFSPIRGEFYADNFARIIDEIKPDIIHSMSWVQLSSIYYANKRRVPIIHTFHGMRDESKVVPQVLIEHLKFCDFTTGLTPENMEDLKNSGFPKHKSYMIPNGTDTTKFYYDEEIRHKIRKDLGVEDSVTVLLTVGSLQHRKGQLSFCKVLNNMPKDFRYLYLIIGTGSDSDAIKDYVKNNGLEEKVKVIGYVPNHKLYAYYSAADIYIHSSYQEGQALSEIEAYTVDLKVAVNRDIIGTVVTDTTNIKDYLVFNYKSFDYKNFVEWSKNHKTNRKTRNQYDWKEIYRQYVEVYYKILQQNERIS